MADPFQELGITRRPLFQMFGLPEDRGASSPRMAQAVRNDLITQAAQMKLDQDIADIERRGQAEAAADEFVRQNPDAAMAGSRRYNDIQQYQQMQMRGPSYSDAVLSRSLANRLKPGAREKFYRNIEAGMGANASYDDAEADEEDMKLRVRLVEAGVPRATIEGMQGRIDQLTAAELLAMAKNGGGSGGKNPEMQALEDNYEMLRKEYEDARTLGEVSPELEKDYLDTRGELLKRRRSLYTPQQQTPDAAKPIVAAVAEGNAAGASGVAPPAAEPVAAPPAPQDIPANVPYSQIPEYLAQIKSTKVQDVAAEKKAISEQWTQQKGALQKRLMEAYPDRVIPGTTTTELEAIARAILNNDPVADDGTVAAIGPVAGSIPLSGTVRARDYALAKIGLRPGEIAFAESGNQRTGLQGVDNRELAEAWAESFLNSRNKLLSTKESATGAMLTPEQAKDFEELSKLINPN